MERRGPLRRLRKKGELMHHLVRSILPLLLICLPLKVLSDDDCIDLATELVVESSGHRARQIINRYRTDDSVLLLRDMILERDAISTWGRPWSNRKINLSVMFERSGNTLSVKINQLSIDTDAYELERYPRELSLRFTKMVLAIFLAADRIVQQSSTIKYVELIAEDVVNSRLLQTLKGVGFQVLGDMPGQYVDMRLLLPVKRDWGSRSAQPQ